jgi:hypothetical protein
MFLCWFLLFTSGFIFAKELPKDLDFPVTISKNDQKRMERAMELTRTGEGLWNDLSARYNPAKAGTRYMDSLFRVDAYPKLMQTSELYRQGNQIKYDVYKSNILSFWNARKGKYTAGLENARRLEKEAAQYMAKAIQNRNAAAQFPNDYVRTYARLYEAIALEIIAVKKLGRSLQMYQDWPIEYNYGFDEDIEVDLFAPKVQIAEKKPDPVPEPDPVPVEVPVDPKGPIEFRVQIAAHTVQMTQANIRDLYKGDLKVDMIQEDGWYKYQIGKFKTHAEAIQCLRQISVDKAFIVGYRNLKRVNLKDEGY